MLTIERPVDATVEQAQQLLRNLTEEGYRFFSRTNGPMIRPAGAYPKRQPSDYAPADARRLQDILMRSGDVNTLVSVASNLGYTLHLVDVTDEGRVVFAKEVLGTLDDNVEQVTARL